MAKHAFLTICSFQVIQNLSLTIMLINGLSMFTSYVVSFCYYIGD